MLSFFDTIHGGATAFDWTHPLTNVTYTVRMVGDSLKAEQAAPNVWKVAFDIEEL
jgi:phage-related protein